MNNAFVCLCRLRVFFLLESIEEETFFVPFIPVVDYVLSLSVVSAGGTKRRRRRVKCTHILKRVVVMTTMIIITIVMINNTNVPQRQVCLEMSFLMS